MATFLLTWNPENWTWPEEDLEEEIDATAEGIPVGGNWSIGVRKGGIEDGDRAFFLRQGSDRRGIVAAGLFSGEIYSEAHWDESGRQATYAEVSWETILDADERIPVEVLAEQVPGVHWNSLRASGVMVRDPADERALEELWQAHISNLGFERDEDA